MASEEILDREALDALRSLGPDDGSLLREIIDLFLAESQPDSVQLQAACASDSRDEVARLAHRLKGMCGNVGATHVERACIELERTVRDNEPHDAVVEAGALVERELQAAQAALAQLR